MNYPHDFAVFIGRFQPFHSGHLQVVQEALRQARQLIILIGSAWQPRNPRNPWHWEEREAMIRASLPAELQGRILCAPLMDVPYNDAAWVRNVQTSVAGLVTAHHASPHRPARVALIGHQKDHTGYYLGLFPQWRSIAVDNWRQISATPLRAGLFAADGQGAAYLNSLADDAILPPGSAGWLQDWMACSSDYADIRDEIAFVQQYHSRWTAAPYPPTFVTADSLVLQSGHLLLVERRARPGKGLWALPGGFVGQHERIEDACLRELREETRLKVPAPVLRGSIRQRRVYDDPNRSARGRTITHAFLIELEPATTLPKVRGGDDASAAFWLPLNELQPQQMFEDHYFIVQDLLGYP